MDEEEPQFKQCGWCEGWGKILKHHKVFDCYHDCPGCGGSGILMLGGDGEWYPAEFDGSVWYTIPDEEYDDDED